MWLGRLNNNSNINGNNRNLNYNNRARGMAFGRDIIIMKKPSLYERLCSYENLELAWRKARKHKTQKHYVIEFEKNLKKNLLILKTELLLHSYRPKPLETFTIRDPKTRKISKSDFRDRVVHHALCNIIEPIFDKGFIHDSYANRLGKGTHKAIERFDYFERKATRNNSRACFVLKADVLHYFDTVSHELLLSIIKRKVWDNKVLFLIRTILKNHKTKHKGKGMPLGNLTSQFFANVYLNELDRYVKYDLRIKYYIRYVDDFVIFHQSKAQLEAYKEKINLFLKKTLDLELHPEKSRIFSIRKGTTFLGLRIFAHHKLLKKSNIRKLKGKLSYLSEQYTNKEIDYDVIYDFLEGWLAYAKGADTYRLRKEIIMGIDKNFGGKTSTKEMNRHQKLIALQVPASPSEP